MNSSFCGEAVILKSKNGEKQFEVRPVTLKDIDAAKQMQREVVDFLDDKSLLIPASEDEMLESAEKDCFLGLYCDNRLAAFLILVLNRDCDRNLGFDWEEKQGEEVYTKYLSVDSTQVHPDYRGYGIQRYLFDLSERIAREKGGEYLIATISPDNPYSLGNALRSGFYPHPEKNPYPKYGTVRVLLRYDVKY